MKKLAAIALALALVLSFAACGQQEKAPADTYEIALVTDVGNIDDKSFNQGTWEGVKAYAEANGKTYNYYRPSEDSDEARIETIKGAIDKGAKVVACPGFLFTGAVTQLQAEYPEVMFLVLDVSLNDLPEPAANTALVTYQEEQAGYFAGYAAVKDGYTKLGFLGGMAVPAVVRFGYGFVQGANDAAKELGNVADVEVKHWYCDSFAPSDDIKTKMSGWYTEGTEVVFACGGGIYLSAVGAAEEAGKVVIGVDRDQAADSELIITSAMKALSPSVQVALGELYANNLVWPENWGGKETKFGVSNDSVGLPTEEASWRFNSYTVDEYNTLYAAVKAGSVAISDSITEAPAVDVAVDYQN